MRILIASFFMSASAIAQMPDSAVHPVAGCTPEQARQQARLNTFLGSQKSSKVVVEKGAVRPSPRVCPPTAEEKDAALKRFLGGGPRSTKIVRGTSDQTSKR